MLLFKKHKAQGLVEYGLILALVSIIAITILGTMGKQIRLTLHKIVMYGFNSEAVSKIKDNNNNNIFSPKLTI